MIDMGFVLLLVELLGGGWLVGGFVELLVV